MSGLFRTYTDNLRSPFVPHSILFARLMHLLLAAASDLKSVGDFASVYI